MSSETTGASSRPPEPSAVERSAARYLFAVSVVAESEGEQVSTGELREYLDVSPASVTEMVSKLDDRGLLDYEKYQGVALTDEGARLATRVAWRFCVVSTFFESVLDAPLDEQTAFDIGYTLPKEGVFSLRDLVSAPCHGFCPEADGPGGECVA